ncbi:hypothetical protein QSJ18_01800 [Gordonia sp. ABSL1-1]|uniref:hypothetical protein n=1 Tax=Gordonia sp. ABSL1-1 TaxID=3053923 RepID=UPI0025743D81|nr:hypothetical protein [Gordonia sp. ABSL1-1]MDL9935472.1 hypothetical protein [Gordonia sp. ABSL1-1]
MPKSRQPAEVAPNAPAEPTTTLDGDAFLEANRVNRDRYREEAERKAEKAARKAERRGGGGAADRVPRKLAGGDSGGGRAARLRSLVGSKLAVAAVVLSILVVALAVSTTVLVFAYRDADRRADAATVSVGAPEQRAAVDAARRNVIELMTYDSANFDDLDRRIEAISTPSFLQQYIATSQEARKGAAEAKSTSTAKISEVGIVGVKGDAVTVLMALDQRIMVPELKAERPDGVPYQSRVKATVVRSGDRWLLDDFAVIT